MFNKGHATKYILFLILSSVCSFTISLKIVSPMVRFKPFLGHDSHRSQNLRK